MIQRSSAGARQVLRIVQGLTVLGVLASLEAQAAAPTDSRSHIRLTFLDCSGKPSDLKAFKLYLLDNDTFQHVESRASYAFEQTPLGLAADVSLPPGFYDLGVMGEKCRDETLIPVLKGRDQTALLIGTNSFRLRESTRMIAGTLPFRGSTVEIVYYPQDQGGRGPKSLIAIPARVDGDAYYATGLPAGTARLAIAATDGEPSRLEFRIGMIGASFLDRDLVFNVSEADVTKALTAPIVTCHPQRTGPTVCSS